MVEVIAEALNLYAKKSGDFSFETNFPLKRWKGATRRDILPYLFRYKGFKSQGTADAIQLFGIGSRIPFKNLLPGDFVNFARTNNSGHAAIFMGFVNSSGSVVPYSQNIVGFRFFSAQGQGRPDGGFGYRIGLFEGECGQNVGNWARKDCGIIRRENDFWLNSGFLFSPKTWRSVDITEAEIEALAISEAKESLLGVGGTDDELRAMAEEIANDNLSEVLDLAQSETNFDGVDTDVEP